MKLRFLYFVSNFRQFNWINEPNLGSFQITSKIYLNFESQSVVAETEDLQY